MKTFIAINMNEFHANQNGAAQTSAQIRFIEAYNTEDAKRFMAKYYPDCAWSVIPKSMIDKNIVHRE